MEIDNHTLLLLFAFLTLASFVHGSIGFGFPLVSTPLIAVIWGVKTAILVTLFPTIIINIANIFHGGGCLRLIKAYWVYPIFIFIGTYLGSLLLVSFDAEPFKLLMAAMIIFYLYVSFSSKLSFREGIFSNKWVYVPLFGIVGGIITGTVNVMLAVVLIYLLGLEMSKQSRIQFMNLSFLYGKISQVAFYGLRPEIYDTGYISILSVLFCIPGLFAGFYLRAKINQALYRKFLNAFLMLISVYLIWQFIEYCIDGSFS